MLREWIARLWGTLRPRRQDADLEEELRLHADLASEAATAGTTDAARRAAAARIGTVTHAMDAVRDQRGLPWLDELTRDVRYGLRTLRRAPLFTTVALLTLAIGIGANTAVFTVVNAAMLQDLPVRAPEQLRNVQRASAPRGGLPSVINTGYGHSFGYPTFEAFRARTDAFSAVVGYALLGNPFAPATIALDGRPAVVSGQVVTGGYFPGLGVSPVIGRAIDEADVRAGAEPVIVLSHGYWARQFGRDPAVIGRALTINRVPATIVGVAPPEFFGLEPGRAPDFWMAISDRLALSPWGNQTVAKDHPPLTSAAWWWMQIVVRLKPGVTDEQARAALNAAIQDSLLGRLTPSPSLSPDRMPRIVLQPGRQGLDRLRQRYSITFFILMGLVGLVLLAACANLGTLLLARATARRKEIAVRLALGASRWRLIRQLLTESLVLAAIGGASGVLVASWGSRALLGLLSGASDPVALDLGPNPLVLAFATIISVLTGVLFGLAPALRATRIRLASGLGARGVTVTAGDGDRSRRGRAGARGSGRIGLGFAGPLIVVQVAVSLLLLVGAGLFVRSLQKLEGQDVGFDRRHLLVFGLDTRQGAYDEARSVAFYNGLRERFAALPGVRAATLTQHVLLSGIVNSAGVVIDGETTSTEPPPQGRAQEGRAPGVQAREGQAREGQAPQIWWNHVGPAFCETMGIRRLLGRDIEPRDTEGPPRVAVINDVMARELFGERSPIGRTFRFERLRGLEQSFEIVGVVETATYASLRDPPRPTAYLPYAFVSGSARMHVALRTAGDPAALMPAVRAIMREAAPDLPLLNLRTQTDQIAESLVRERLFARLSSFFGVVALLLACIGLHGTLAYAVGRRTQEIGIRMALGAQRRQVLGLILRDAILLVAGGVLLGVPLAIAASRLVTSQLFRVTGSDPVTLWAASALMIGTALVAAFLPARRATRIEPMAALRNE